MQAKTVSCAPRQTPIQPGQVLQPAALPFAVGTADWLVGPFNKRGDEEIAVRFSHLSAPNTDSGKMHAFKIPFAGQGDRKHFKASKKNIEDQSLKVTRDIHTPKGRKPGPLAAKETEIIGEVAAMRAIMSWPSLQGYEMVTPVNPGHGRGVDQFWFMGPEANPTEYLIVEAKGPGASLAPGQMRKSWVITRLRRLVTGATSDDVKEHAQNAIDAIINGAPPKVRGVVLKARWDINRKGLTASASHDTYYN